MRNLLIRLAKHFVKSTVTKMSDISNYKLGISLQINSLRVEAHNVHEKFGLG